MCFFFIFLVEFTYISTENIGYGQHATLVLDDLPVKEKGCFMFDYEVLGHPVLDVRTYLNDAEEEKGKIMFLVHIAVL